MDYKYLYNINSPADLRKLKINELNTVVQELREFLIDTVSKVGGHLGASLGVAELTVALHYVFNTPEDKIVWDVGHQGYIHKILTGRRDRLITIKQKDGISGFLKRSESEYDTFGAGHASTSISAALGMAAARDFLKKNNKVIAVIGDGSMTGGMAYEAMNNIGMLKKDIIVVLNDNRMSIAKNVWAFHNYFSEFIVNPSYNKFRNYVWDAAGKFDKLGDRIRTLAHRVESGIKGVFTPGMLFEALGFRYVGPMNGHNIVNLVKVLEEIRTINGPILLHVVSEKGKGYKPAESHEQRLHASTPFDKITGQVIKKSGLSPVSFTKIFGEAMVEICKMNDKVVGITAAMPDGTGLDILEKEMPEKFFDVGIAEQHAVTFAAGMATEGFSPVCAIYSTFLQRAFDQIIHDVALQKLHIVFVLDRAGLVGADGPTHHGALDLSYLRCIPNMVIMAPKDEIELRNMLYTASLYTKGPIALRYPRGNAFGLKIKPFKKVEIGKGEIVERGKDVAILAIGNMVHMAMQAREELLKENVDVEVVNMRFVKPLDVLLLRDIFKRYKKVLTIEDNNIVGGFGSAVIEYMNQNKIKDVDLIVHGLPDKFVEHAKPEELYEMLRMDGKGLANIIREHFLEKISVIED